MTLRVVTPPDLLVSLEDVKKHLNVDHGDDDAQITTLIGAATQAIESAVQRRYRTQVLEWVLPCWQRLCLPVAPVSATEIVISYADPVTGDLVTLPDDQYRTIPEGQTLLLAPVCGVILPLLDPYAGERVIIRFTAGTDAPPDVAAAACKLMVQYYYEQHDWPLAASGLPRVVDNLLASERWD